MKVWLWNITIFMKDCTYIDNTLKLRVYKILKKEMRLKQFITTLSKVTQSNMLL